MNWIKRIFIPKKDKKDKIESLLSKHNNLLIEKIIKLLKDNPDKFSSMWFNGKTMDNSIRNNKGNIVIMINSGEIIRPISCPMNIEQKETIKKLILPIVERDSKYLLDRIEDDFK